MSWVIEAAFSMWQFFLGVANLDKQDHPIRVQDKFS